MKKRDLFAMKERDLNFDKFNKTFKISLSVANLRNQAMPYGSLDIYLRHTLIILSENIRLIIEYVLKLEKVFFSPWQHILKWLVTYSLKANSHVQKFSECLTV